MPLTNINEQNNYYRKIISSHLLLLVFFNLNSCINAGEKTHHSTDNKNVNPLGYNLSDPDKTIPLPLILQEVSGIALIDSTSVACVQDENGIIFIFNLLKNEITKQIPFHSNGDYEGIASTEKSIYVLRSDGVLYEIVNYESLDYTKKIFSAGIPPADNEGLCYDKKNNRLLIVPKSKLGRGSEYKKKHPVYGFDLHSELLIAEPVFDFTRSAIKKFVEDNGVRLPEKNNTKRKDDDDEIKFRPSAIGIHPVTNSLYVLSASDGMLYVFNMNGTIEYAEKLNPDIFNMPEGIAFYENGDMLISNEGRINPPTILKFNYKKK